ncbi:AMP-binding protein [Actinophytocola sp.]|uniref:AMP-binding protein n=1 Tax=Actinophytocola sp. TaxID=1872138 RepID=UPI003D6C3F0D
MDNVVTTERRAELESAGLWTTDTLAGKLVEHATRAPSSPAVIDGTDGREVSYGELLRDVRALAHYLSEHGISSGDTVSVQLPNRYEAVVVDLAVLMVGGVLNPLLPNYRAKELRHILRVARSRGIVTTTTYRRFDFVEMVRGLRPELPELDLHVVVGEVVGESADLPSTDTILRAGGGEDLRPVRPANAVSEIIFTSGTEAAPKAVMHTEQTANFGVRNAYEWLRMGADDCVWMPSPVGHSTGLNYGIRFAVFHGLPLVLQDIWDARRAVELIARFGCTYTLAATTFLADLVRASAEGTADLKTMRAFSCGGSPVPPELVRAAAARGIGVLRLYGSTELLGVTWAPPDVPDGKRENTDGAIMPHVEIEVRDDAGRPVPRGTPGELVARSPSAAVGFFDDPERTAATFLPGGWVRSGDLVVLDTDDYMTVVGRKKEIIIRGGINIAPRELEDVLATMPGVAAVAVVGLPDERLGEIACACVVPDDAGSATTLDDLIAFLERHDIAKYKYPQRVEIVPRLPMTPSGKVQKHVLRAAFTQESG